VITEALSLNRIPEEIQQRCRQADITSKSMLLQVARQPTTEAMHDLLDRIAQEGISREEARRFNKPDKPARRTRHYTYRFKPEQGDYQFTIRFARPNVERTEVIRALQDLLLRLTAEEAAPDAAPGRPVEHSH